MSNSRALWPTLKRLLAYGLPWKKTVGAGVLLLWVAAGAEVAGPVLVSYFIDHLVSMRISADGGGRVGGRLCRAAGNCGVIALCSGADVQPSSGRRRAAVAY